jgi:hypothetical protein
MTSALSHYIGRGNKQVQGWLSRLALDVIVEVSEEQRAVPMAGPVCEIGVHHGRLFILLHLLSTGDERAVACDLFARQRENVDGSGAGHAGIFTANAKRHGCDLDRIAVVTANSLELTPDVLLREGGGRFRLFSIDGGHTPEITYNDLRLAHGVLAEGGVIIVDDFFNEDWPGVAAGTCRYLRDCGNALLPSAIAGGKVLFTNDRALAQRYAQRLSRARPGHRIKKSGFFDADVVTISRLKTFRSYVTETAFWRRLRERPMGRLIRQRLGRGVS